MKNHILRLSTIAIALILASALEARALTFTNPAPIAINDFGPATPYPATITISGLTTPILDINVVINGLSHTFPSDIGILLVGPGGQKVVLMDGAGALIRSVTLISSSMTRQLRGFHPVQLFLPAASSRLISFPLTLSILRHWQRVLTGRCYLFLITSLRTGLGVCLSEIFPPATVEASAAASACKFRFLNLRRSCC
jgi:hypothetical protein